MKEIAFIVGTRPEIIKLYSLIKLCQKLKHDFIIIHTNQHYDKNMSDVFFEELSLPQPDYSIGVGSGSHASMLAKMIVPIENILLDKKPDVVIVQGDTNTVLAGCLAAAKLNIKVGHVEAGLRSYDRSMPEEHNRIIADHVADYLFAPTRNQQKILRQEGVARESIFITGNTIVDAVLDLSSDLRRPVLKPYFLLTCHRPSNTDNPQHFRNILSAIDTICQRKKMICIFPVHPRLKSKLSLIGGYKHIKVIKPQNYKTMLSYIKYAELIFTDSGGIQEEACILQKKCVILRTNTERPETIAVGGAVTLPDIQEESILAAYKTLDSKDVNWRNPFGDGMAAQRIIDILERSS